MMNESERKPAILVFLDGNLNEGEITDILYGIEEEGIPYRVRTETLSNPFDLAYQAAQESTLSVGIGCSRNEIILTQRNISKMKYIMKIKFKDSARHKRSLGVNAARLVKGNAFKDLDLMEV
jgi:hypothetical protein